MIIDVNTYIGHWPFRQLRNNTTEGLIEIMDYAGIDKACVSNINSIFYKDTQEGNRELEDKVKSHKDRFIPFAIINPTYAAWDKDLNHCIDDLDFKGVELYPYYHNYSLLNSQVEELFKLAAQMKVPVHLPAMIVNIRQRHWMDTEESLAMGEVTQILESCPDTDVIITSSSCSRNLKKVIDKRKGRVYFDFSMQKLMDAKSKVAGLYRLIDISESDRVVFGSASPFRYIDPQLIRLEYLDLDKKEKKMIMSGNLAELFNL